MTVTRTLLRSPALGALTSPHGVDRYLELVNPMWAAHEVRARVVGVRRETRGEAPVATLTLQPTSTWAGHRAGQHVQVGVDLDGARRATRVFSVSSAESSPGERFTITVRADPGGVVSSFLVHRAEPGQILHLSQAEGEFTLPEPVPDRLLLVSGGSGITPVMSMVRTLLRDGYAGRVAFLHYSRSPEDQIYRDELAGLARARNGVDVHLVHPRHGGAHLSANELARLVPDHAEVPAWACGPAGLVEAVREARAGCPGALRLEYFKTPRPATTGAAGGGRVSFTRSGHSREDSGETLLEQAEALGLAPAYGCRMGICGSCTTRKREGAVRHVISGAESSLPDEDIQVCVSAPAGDCSVDL